MRWPFRNSAVAEPCLFFLLSLERGEDFGNWPAWGPLVRKGYASLQFYHGDKRGKKKNIFEELQMLTWKMSGLERLLAELFRFLSGKTFVFRSFPVLRAKATLRSQSSSSSLSSRLETNTHSYVAVETTIWHHSRGEGVWRYHESSVNVCHL